MGPSVSRMRPSKSNTRARTVISFPIVLAVPSEVLRNRNAVVTGASRGIGAAAARALDGAGARVALVARQGDALAEVAAGLANDPVVIAADLAHVQAPAAVAEQALA